MQSRTRSGCAEAKKRPQESKLMKK